MRVLLPAIVWFIAWAPIAMWTVAFAHAVRAWRFLGFWPSYGRPDPKNLPPFLLDERLDFVVGWIVVIVAAGVSTYFTRRRLAWSFAAVVVLWAAAFLLVRLDPGGILDWYLD